MIYVFGKYYFVDLKTIEPICYMPNIIEPVYKTGYYKSPFRTYFSSINNFGSRNLFEVSKEDKNLVILLGDSHFFGESLNDDEIISYFSNKLDSKNKYINLAIPGFNVCDSVQRYLLKKEKINSPIMILFEILLINDIYASRYIEEKIEREIEKDYKFILQPFRIVLSKRKLFAYYYGNIQEKIYDDLSNKRLVEYILNPLSKLMMELSRNNSKLMLISYDVNDKVEKYNAQLKDFCLQNNVYFFNLHDLINNYSIEKNERFPDGHPTANFNRVLAGRIKDKLVELGLIN